MFEVGFQELLLIFIIALVVLGPTRLPGLVSKVGRWVGKARTMARQFREQLENEVNLDELNKMTEARTPPKSTYPPPPPGFNGEPRPEEQAGSDSDAAAEPRQTGQAGSDNYAAADPRQTGQAGSDNYAAAEPGSTIPPEDASHNDLSDPVYEPPKESVNERAT